MASWLQPLPKLIWELGDGSPDTTTLALRMLLDAARFTPCRLGDAPATPLRQALEALQPQLGPLFCMHLPSRKSLPLAAAPALVLPSGGAGPSACCPACSREQAEAAGRVVQARAGGQAAAAATSLTPGPLSKLPLEVQLAAVDLMYHLSE